VGCAKVVLSGIVGLEVTSVSGCPWHLWALQEREESRMLGKREDWGAVDRSDREREVTFSAPSFDVTVGNLDIDVDGQISSGSDATYSVCT